jgi:hypothetical protein
MIDFNQIENCKEESAKNPGHYPYPSLKVAGFEPFLRGRF